MITGWLAIAGACIGLAALGIILWHMMTEGRRGRRWGARSSPSD